MFWSVPRIWVGGTVAMLAGGPSLTYEQVERLVMATPYIGVLAMNLSYRLLYGPAPLGHVPSLDDMLFAADAQRSWAHYPEMVKFIGRKVLLWGVEPPKEKRAAMCRLAAEHDVRVLRHIGNHDGLSDDPTTVRGNNGIHQAINIAVLAGAKRILLLGADLRSGPDGRLYWHGEKHPWHAQARLNFPAQIASIETTVQPLRRKGVDVINCTPDSALRCFPAMSLEEALRG